MLGDMAQSRSRIEFLQRMGAWQGMAQRLAHEIKNPLTPIQLAVQECHRKYQGEDARFRGLLDTTLEIVEEEVGTLRRLVGNFSAFARLPTSELKEASLRDFLRECSAQLTHLADPSLGEDDSDDEPAALDDTPGARFQPSIDITWGLPEAPLVVAFDRQMLRRVLVNLVRNAAQAIRDDRPAGAAPPLGQVKIRAYEEPGGVAIDVSDDGPGIAVDARTRVFEPYFTTKSDGTGLGLAIVKKIVVEHGGTIEAMRSEWLGGASIVVHLPRPQREGPPSGKIPRDDPSYAELRRAGEV